MPSSVRRAIEEGLPTQSEDNNNLTITNRNEPASRLSSEERINQIIDNLTTLN